MKQNTYDFGPYKRHVPGKDSTMEYGTYYEKSVRLPFDLDDDRMIRVWLPPHYEEDQNKRYPVIYMSDGQNLVDRELSAYGDWHMDKTVNALMEEGLSGVILVGIDCPKDPAKRANELNPPFPIKPYLGEPSHPYGNLYLDYIVKVLKPEIDKLFRTKADLLHTGIGGSSMGGIMAFHAYMAYPNDFGFSMAFSVPTFFYKMVTWKHLIDEVWAFDPNTKRKLAMWVGGEGFEKKFTPGNFWIYRHLTKMGMNESNFHFESNLALPHHEESWARYAKEALRFFLKDC